MLFAGYSRVEGTVFGEIIRVVGRVGGHESSRANLVLVALTFPAPRRFSPRAHLGETQLERVEGAA